jgi:hypothetical protein
MSCRNALADVLEASDCCPRNECSKRPPAVV